MGKAKQIKPLIKPLPPKKPKPKHVQERGRAKPDKKQLKNGRPRPLKHSIYTGINFFKN